MFFMRKALSSRYKAERPGRDFDVCLECLALSSESRWEAVKSTAVVRSKETVPIVATRNALPEAVFASVPNIIMKLSY